MTNLPFRTYRDIMLLRPCCQLLPDKSGSLSLVLDLAGVL